MGRSTVNEGGLLKVKRFSHGEAEIVGFEELMHNENETYTNELGNDVRSSHAENLVPSGRLGAYVVYHPAYAEAFKISCGSMTHAQAKWAWENRQATLGDITRFKHFAHGVKAVPRHGIWAGFRHNDDLGREHPLWADIKLTGQKATLEFPKATFP
jgi:DNA ligase-1